MVAEPTAVTYSDAALAIYIERYPLLDSLGRDPWQIAATVQPPALEQNEDWVETWDLHRAAADVWEEKGAGLATKVSFATDGQSFSMNQQYDRAMARARWHRSRRSGLTTKLWAYPRLNPTLEQVVNAPELG
jgi:hypothetical protein